jgi:methionine-rich copper-binding protein CopC
MRTAPWILAATVVLSAPGLAQAQGPGSGDEVTTQKLSPAMQRRIWKASRARRAQLRRIRELKRRIAALEEALPVLQRQAMKEADYYRSARARYQRHRKRFKAKWGRIQRLFGGRSPVKSYTDRYGSFRVREVYSADTNDWKRASRRKDHADGDDFYLYATITMPKELVGKHHYAVDWRITGYDFLGQERSLYSVHNWSRSGSYHKIKWTGFRLRRRVTGLGLTPGWYEVRATLKVRGKSWLKRSTYSVIRISQVNPKVSAPPASRYRRTDETKIKLTRLKLRSRGRRGGKLDPSRFSVRGGYRVHADFTGSDKHLLVGADVYGVTARGKTGRRPLRSAFRYRKRLRRTRGRFGSRDTTRVKDLDQGLKPGRYILRVWVLVGTEKRNYWSYEDRPFVVKPARPNRRRARGRR